MDSTSRSHTRVCIGRPQIANVAMHARVSETLKVAVCNVSNSSRTNILVSLSIPRSLSLSLADRNYGLPHAIFLLHLFLFLYLFNARLFLLFSTCLFKKTFTCLRYIRRDRPFPAFLSTFLLVSYALTNI